MTGYTPAEQDIRAARGLPYATGADAPPAWHDHPPEDASDVAPPRPAPASRDFSLQQLHEGITGLHWDNLGHGGAA